jgi:hypothetical protein
VGIALLPVFCFPRRSQCEFSLDKRNRRRYHVSVSQQNIVYGTRKKDFSLGVWFFVVSMITHEIIIGENFLAVKYPPEKTWRLWAKNDAQFLCMVNR